MAMLMRLEDVVAFLATLPPVESFTLTDRVYVGSIDDFTPPRHMTRGTRVENNQKRLDGLRARLEHESREYECQLGFCRYLDYCGCVSLDHTYFRAQQHRKLDADGQKVAHTGRRIDQLKRQITAEATPSHDMRSKAKKVAMNARRRDRRIAVSNDDAYLSMLLPDREEETREYELCYGEDDRIGVDCDFDLDDDFFFEPEPVDGDPEICDGCGRYIEDCTCPAHDNIYCVGCRNRIENCICCDYDDLGSADLIQNVLARTPDPRGLIAEYLD